MQKNGFELVGVDINEKVVILLNHGEIHIEEVGLGELIKKLVQEGKLRTASSSNLAYVFIISVLTPNCPDHTANLEYVKGATESILPFLRTGNVIDVLKIKLNLKSIKSKLLFHLIKAYF